jgi:glycogen(starch) synthase
VLGFIGSFFSFEGLPMLVDVCARLRERYPRLRLVLVGEGEDTARLRQLIERLDLTRNVWMVGRVPHGEVLGFYAAMDVLIYPRYPSALTQMISPLKPLEPMAMGRCVVASDVGGLRELIRDRETGLLFTAGSAPSLLGTLELLLSGGVSAPALGNAARDYVVAHRQWRHMAAVYESAYKRAQQTRRAA